MPVISVPWSVTAALMVSKLAFTLAAKSLIALMILLSTLAISRLRNLRRFSNGLFFSLFAIPDSFGGAAGFSNPILTAPLARKTLDYLICVSQFKYLTQFVPLITVPLVLDDNLNFPAGSICYRMSNTLLGNILSGPQDLFSNPVPNSSLNTQEMSSRIISGHGVCSAFTYEAGSVAEKPEQALSCEVREVIMRKLVPHPPVRGKTLTGGVGSLSRLSVAINGCFRFRLLAVAVTTWPGAISRLLETPLAIGVCE